ncbi:hypothetical protein DM02DRAFT_609587 [Periconia macrospinosa]|uniref:Transcription factor domain-containing protein n=1 Tax=Periconia macrospinosa TaxID=97972 RepID=A0A2V1EC10_9PLEO|nr:hypothetical protein DM02DRAFT_609587 [Periconia macrospinosa]
MPAFEFITSDSTGKPTATDLRRVRSRCMRGVHKKPNSRRSVREAKQQQEQARIVRLSNSIPSPLCTDLSTITFADTIGPDSRRLIHKVLASDLMSQFLAPVEEVTEFPLDKTAAPISWLSDDAPFLYAVLFTGSLMEDLLSHERQEPRSETYKYLRKTIASLNEKLNKPGSHLEDSTLQVVMNLAMSTAVMGDWDAAWTHSAGLHRILALKGGFQYLLSNAKLHYKIDRIIMAMAIGLGKKLFCPFNQSTMWIPLYPAADPTTGFSFDIRMIPEIDDQRLIDIFRDLQHFAWELNERVQNGERCEGTYFQKATHSIQSRMMHLPDRCDDSASELLHVGMYACVTPVFNTFRRNLQFSSLAHRLKNLHRSIEMSLISEAHADLVIWVLVMSAMTVTSTEDFWIREKWAMVIGKLGLSLEGLKSRLSRVVWLGPFFEGAYRKTYNALSREDVGIFLANRSKAHES